MERQLVAPTIDQWRSVQRSQRDQAAAYNPLEITRGFRPRNRQLLRITSDTADDATGFFPAVWLQSDVSDQSHAEQSDVWAWPIDGAGAEDAFFEGETVGTHEEKPVFRGWMVEDDFPDVLRIVTNVCPVGESAGNRFTAADNYEISTEGGQAIVVGTINAKAGITSVRAVVDWTDPDFEAGTGDSFSFYLIADGTDYTGAPPHLVTFVGNGASMQKEMVWNVLLSEDKTINLALWAYRISGSRSLVASTTSRLEVNSDVAGTKVEYRQLILNGGAHVGPKICITNPADCCIDDESSTQDTGSDLTVTCCSVPVPSMRSVDLSGMVSFASGWFAVGFGYYANYDYLIGRVRDELNKLHYLPYIGEIVDTRTRCLYEKTISIPDAYVLSYFGFPTEETEGSTEYIPSFSIRLRFFISERLPGESSPFYDWNLSGGVPVGYIAAGEYQAHCGLSLEYFTDGGPWAGLAAFTGVYTPHYSNEFYATQPVGTYPRLRNGNLPDPGTSCAGACSLYLVQGTLTNGSYEGEAGPTAVGYPLTASVEAV